MTKFSLEKKPDKLGEQEKRIDGSSCSKMKKFNAKSTKKNV